MSNRQIAEELDLNESDGQAMAEALRGGRVQRRPPVRMGGMLERGGTVRIVLLENVQQQTIRPLIEATIKPGTVVNTDE